jgi:hypothetical protein
MTKQNTLNWLRTESKATPCDRLYILQSVTPYCYLLHTFKYQSVTFCSSKGYFPTDSGQWPEWLCCPATRQQQKTRVATNSGWNILITVVTFRPDSVTIYTDSTSRRQAAGRRLATNSLRPKRVFRTANSSREHKYVMFWVYFCGECTNRPFTGTCAAENGNILDHK